MGLWNVGSATARAVSESVLNRPDFDPPEPRFDKDGRPIPRYNGGGCSVGARDIGRSSSIWERDWVVVNDDTNTYYIDASVDFKTWHRDNETSWFSRLFE